MQAECCAVSLSPKHACVPAAMLTVRAMPLACRPAACDDDPAAAGAAGEEEDVETTQAALEERRQQNIRALVSGADLNCRRAALMPRLLTVQQVRWA